MKMKVKGTKTTITFDHEQMMKGMEEEQKEHGNDIKLIRKIVEDHLKIDPKYYDTYGNKENEEE